MQKLKIPLNIPTVDIVLYRGDDRTIPLKLIGRDNQPINFSGATIRLHAKVDDQPQPVIALSTDEGGIEAENGRLILHFDHAATVNADWQMAHYDVEINTTSQTKTLFKGKIKLEHDITRKEQPNG